MILDLSELTPRDRQRYLQHVIVPRPICFASTINAQRQVNLSPFSFFNLFSTNPPVVIFSPCRRLRDNTFKDTLKNINEVPEVVINMVTMDMVHQVSLASSEYSRGTDEFLKAGFTKQQATKLKVPMVLESPMKIECKVLEVKSLGSTGGAGQLVICEVLILHIDDSLIDDAGNLKLPRTGMVARLGDNLYCRVSRENTFKVPKPGLPPGVGFDKLPECVRESSILTGSELAILAGVPEVPVQDQPQLSEIMIWLKQSSEFKGMATERNYHHAIRLLLQLGKIDWAWQVALFEGSTE